MRLRHEGGRVRRRGRDANVALQDIRERLREEQQAASDKAMEEGDYMAAAMAMWSTPFLPNLLNTAVFLVETAQCVAVLVVNYKVRVRVRVRVS